MQIEITVINKKAIAKDYYQIVCGNSDYTVKFSFDSEWDKYTTKTARFNFTQNGVKKYTDVVFEGTECNMPVLSGTSYVEIGVFAGDLQTTTPSFLRCEKSILCDNGTPEEPPEDVYNQIMEKCNEAVDTSKRVEAETKELNEQSKAVLEAEAERMAAEEYRQYSEDERKNNELLRDEHEINRQSAEEERQQTFETLKDEFEHNNQAMSHGLDWFENEGQSALYQFQADTSTALADFDVEKQQALDHFTEQSTEALERVQIATENANEATGRANNAVDTMNNNFSNALKGNASGEVVVISDISPIEHNLGVKLSNPDATLKAQGKNWFNNDISLIQSVFFISESGAETTRLGYQMSLPEGTYTIRAIQKAPFEGYAYVYGCLVGEDNLRQKAVNLVTNGSVNSPITFTIEKGVVLLIYDGIGSNKLEQTQKLFGTIDIQLEVGKSVTEYESYIEPISYTPNADGTVEGVKGIYPNMTLYTDTSGVLVECGYNKDTNKVIENLVNAILSLGGNV